jgi:hypothetical protein
LVFTRGSSSPPGGRQSPAREKAYYQNGAEWKHQSTTTPVSLQSGCLSGVSAPFNEGQQEEPIKSEGLHCVINLHYQLHAMPLLPHATPSLWAPFRVKCTSMYTVHYQLHLRCPHCAPYFPEWFSLCRGVAYNGPSISCSLQRAHRAQPARPMFLCVQMSLEHFDARLMVESLPRG